MAKVIIGSIKYKNITRLNRNLLRESPNTFKTLPKDAIYTSIPLHSSRKNQRGFNQVDLIGTYLFKEKYIPGLIVRRVSTKRQSSLSKEMRKENVKNSFLLSPKYYTNREAANKIVLIDDLITTSSTIEEITRLIKERYPTVGVSALALFRGRKPKNYSLTTSPS